jgi:hypothetical protein
MVDSVQYNVSMLCGENLLNAESHLYNKRIFRYKMEKQIELLVLSFVKNIKQKDRKEFKKEWADWLEKPEVKEKICIEESRLTDYGYKGNVIDKMFKSARYYYYKKKEDSQDIKKEKEKRGYHSFQTEILQLMDNQIKQIYMENNFVSPATGFFQFISSYSAFLEKEKQRSNEEWSEEKWIAKCKKTYKNRFYKYCKSS